MYGIKEFAMFRHQHLRSGRGMTSIPIVIAAINCDPESLACTSLASGPVEFIVLAIPVVRRCGRPATICETLPRHASPGLNGRFGDVACASHSPQAVPTRQGREVGAIEEHRTVESQEIHNR